jgi:hypothetical protein
MSKGLLVQVVSLSLRIKEDTLRKTFNVENISDINDMHMFSALFRIGSQRMHCNNYLFNNVQENNHVG